LFYNELAPWWKTRIVAVDAIGSFDLNDLPISKTRTIRFHLVIVQTKGNQLMGNSILYIEDNPDNRTLVKRVLESRGYTLLFAPNGLTGVSMAENEEVKMILLDINLPDIDGYEVARRIRKSNKKASLAYIPIIALTANALKDDAKKAISAGCNAYMSKPIDISELWERVEAFLPPPTPHS
jgi:two-component system, cell cycle response regulator DivK